MSFNCFVSAFSHFDVALFSFPDFFTSYHFSHLPAHLSYITLTVYKEALYSGIQLSNNSNNWLFIILFE